MLPVLTHNKGAQRGIDSEEYLAVANTFIAMLDVVAAAHAVRRECGGRVQGGGHAGAHTAREGPEGAYSESRYMIDVLTG